MAKREWGLLCPEGHGLLHERPEWTDRGVVWCPSAEHGGNGRFWRRNEVQEGWFDPTRDAQPSEEYLERQAEAHRRSLEWDAERKERAKMAKQTTPKAKATPKAKEPRNCLCGCGGQTKGGRFIPGHDARFHSRIKTLMGQFGLGHDEAEKIASKGPLTGKYAVKPAAKAEAKPESIKTARTRKPKQPDLTAKATDEPVGTDEADVPAEDIAL
jgi:hypothetical protein